MTKSRKKKSCKICVITLFSKDWQKSCKGERKYRSPGVEEGKTTASRMREQRGKIEAALEGGEGGKV